MTSFEFHFMTNTIFQNILQNEIMWLQDTGILNRLTLDIQRPPIHIPDPKLRYKLPLTMTQLSTIMIAVLVGSVLSVGVFLLEILLRNKVSGLELAEEMIELD